MPIIYAESVKTARMQAVLTEIGDAAVVKLYTAGGSASGTLLASFTLPTPSGVVGGSPSDTLILDLDPDVSDTSADNNGTAAVAEVHTSGGTPKITGLTVGTSGTDVTISPSTTITAGQTVTLTALSIQHG